MPSPTTVAVIADASSRRLRRTRTRGDAPIVAEADDTGTDVVKVMCVGRVDRRLRTFSVTSPQPQILLPLRKLSRSVLLPLVSAARAGGRARRDRPARCFTRPRKGGSADTPLRPGDALARPSSTLPRPQPRALRSLAQRRTTSFRAETPRCMASSAGWIAESPVPTTSATGAAT